MDEIFQILTAYFQSEGATLEGSFNRANLYRNFFIKGPERLPEGMTLLEWLNKASEEDITAMVRRTVGDADEEDIKIAANHIYRAFHITEEGND